MKQVNYVWMFIKIHRLIAPVVLFSILVSCNKQLRSPVEEEIATSSVRNGLNPRQGVIYTESNEAGTNRILSYLQNPNGSLSFLESTASGGNGSGTGLGSQGALQLSSDRNWLFAVNAGSNSISSFSVDDNGELMLASTVSSNGTLPVSVTVWNNLLYVVNSTSANISGFMIGGNGSLSLIAGSNQSLSAANAAPAQISFSPDGSYLLVTEKMTNKITRFPVNGSGVAGAGSSITSSNTTPFGFDFSGNYAIVSEAAGGAPNASTVSSYLNGTTLISGPVHADQGAACWVDITSDGKYAYVSNTASNNLSLFGVDGNGMVNVIEPVAAVTGMGPIDLTLSSNEFFLYVINGASHSISAYRKGHNSNLQHIGDLEGLPNFAVGLVAK